jgi:hypothetical protein
MGRNMHVVKELQEIVIKLHYLASQIRTQSISNKVRAIADKLSELVDSAIKPYKGP